MIECGVYVCHATEVDVVGEFVDEDVFCFVGVSGVAEEVFFSTGAVWVRDAAACASGACVPEVFGGDAWEFGGEVCEAFEFWEVCGEFVVGDDAEAGSAFDHGLADVVTFGEHLVY